MLTPCQTLASEKGHNVVDKMLFTTARRGALAIIELCDRCPSEAKADCAKRATSIITPAGVIPAEGVFGGVFHA
jgi:hypothetical protein